MAPSLETTPTTILPLTTKKPTQPTDQEKDQSTAVTISSSSGSGPHGKEGLTALQAISQGTALPGIPSFTTVEKQRAWILEHMAGAFRVFARFGYAEGMAGHISVRDPEDPKTFWTNP